jgi:hypothetical protein
VFPPQERSTDPNCGFWIHGIGVVEHFQETTVNETTENFAEAVPLAVGLCVAWTFVS